MQLKKTRGRNSSHDTNKRRETRSQRYNEGGKVKEKNAQIETKNRARQEE